MKRSIKNSITPNWTRILLISTLFAFHAGEAAADRAYPFHDSYCFENEGYKICYATQGVFSETRTPSGNTAYMGNGTSSYILRLTPPARSFIRIPCATILKV